VIARSSALLLTSALASCGSVQQFRVRILDEAGRPLPGAIFYEETYVPGSPARHVDFTWAVAGADGWAPPRGASLASVRTPFRSCAIVAVFVPGRLPLVSMERAPCPSSKGPVESELRLADPGDSLPYNFRYIQFPFLEDAELREKARSPEAAPLRAALRHAASMLQAREGSLGTETLQALDALERTR
jgi:hypothetical protein